MHNCRNLHKKKKNCTHKLVVEHVFLFWIFLVSAFLFLFKFSVILVHRTNTLNKMPEPNTETRVKRTKKRILKQIHDFNAGWSCRTQNGRPKINEVKKKTFIFIFSKMLNQFSTEYNIRSAEKNDGRDMVEEPEETEQLTGTILWCVAGWFAGEWKISLN